MDYLQLVNTHRLVIGHSRPEIEEMARRIRELMDREGIRVLAAKAPVPFRYTDDMARELQDRLRLPKISGTKVATE
jgi:hypothetical protein